MKKIIILLGLLFFPLYSTFALDTETEKIQWHLDRVEWILRKVETPSLTEDQKLNRTKMLDLLHAYTEVGKFPNNDKYPGVSVPFFRWSNGNLCAVGYLMNNDPEYRWFVESVVTQNNTVQIMDIQNDPTVKSWAKKYWFSTLELAMIQPTYGWKYQECSMRHINNCNLRESYELLGEVYDNRNSQFVTYRDWLSIFYRIWSLLLGVFIFILLSCIFVLSIIWVYFRKHTLGPKIKKILYILCIFTFITWVLIILNYPR